MSYPWKGFLSRNALSGTKGLRHIGTKSPTALRHSFLEVRVSYYADFFINAAICL